MRDRICIVCGRPLGETPLMTLADMPASAQDIPVREELGEEQGITLSLHQCQTCGLVQFDCEPVAYYKDVIRSGGFTTTMVNLRKRQYRHFIDRYHLEGKKLIEAGCGQGEFLGLLSDFPVKAYGIENRESLVRLAKEKGLTVWKQFAAEGEVLAADDGSASGPFDGFLSFNFLEHQPDPVGMLRCIADNLSEEGVGLITVPSLEYILQYDGYYELIRDHLAYYTFDTLRYAVEKAGFQVLEEEMINRDTLSVIVKKSPAVQPEDSRKLMPVDISGLKESLDTIGSELEELVDGLKSQGKTLGIWGASHQGFTLASTTVIGRFARYIIDSAPFKQGKYAPASHLPIVPPDHFHMDPVDAILIVAPGYTDEIAGIIQERFGGNVEILALKSNHLERI
ncbi:class I SAM-dependent methyltransferase [Lacrimispora celerecrescens]|uniref:C-methyltransferase-like protein n=1 Tax=[Clostridium] celerecrescens 18A TaxID=1286362 RepID=A0A2M8ZC00_9FIRM|nr:class I SAM-dependent methyltransferase [Lacrimispora celerecrescens]PJJ30960.1 C-methyltransferase-like protein [[Clostridium] celerecrescens 18A]